jgi:integrase
MTLGRVGHFTVTKLRKDLLDKGLSEATANRVAATWNHAAGWLTTPYDKAGKPQKPLHNKPLPRIKTPKEDNRRDFVFTEKQETAFLAAAAADISPDIWLFAVLAFASSMRHREILSGRFEHLDETARRLRIKIKGGRWRNQPLPQYAVDAIVERREMLDDQEGWIFPNPRSKSGRVDLMTKPWKRCAIAAGLNPKIAVPHAARHTAITRYSALVGGDIAMIKEFSGHKSIDMILRYSHPSRRRVDDVLARMATKDQSG